MGRELRPGTRVVRSARALPPGEGTPVAPPLVQSVAFDYRSAAAQDEVFGNDHKNIFAALSQWIAEDIFTAGFGRAGWRRT